MFRDLPTIVGLPPDRVLFTLDNLRYPEDEANGRSPYFDATRSSTLTLAHLDIMRRMRRGSSISTTVAG